jgi:hypothetical protein
MSAVEGLSSEREYRRDLAWYICVKMPLLIAGLWFCNISLLRLCDYQLFSWALLILCGIAAHSAHVQLIWYWFKSGRRIESWKRMVEQERDIKHYLEVLRHGPVKR